MRCRHMRQSSELAFELPRGETDPDPIGIPAELPQDNTDLSRYGLFTSRELALMGE